MRGRPPTGWRAPGAIGLATLPSRSGDQDGRHRIWATDAQIRYELCPNPGAIFAQFNLTKHTPASAPARSRAAALARAVGRPWEVGRPRGHLPVVVAPGRASPRLAVPGRRRACRRGSRVAADSEVCTIDRHGDPPVGRGASAPLCRDGTILAHGRSPWGPNPE